MRIVELVRIVCSEVEGGTGGCWYVGRDYWGPLADFSANLNWLPSATLERLQKTQEPPLRSGHLYPQMDHGMPLLSLLRAF